MGEKKNHSARGASLRIAHKIGGNAISHIAAQRIGAKTAPSA